MTPDRICHRLIYSTVYVIIQIDEQRGNSCEEEATLTELRCRHLIIITYHLIHV